jgi:hypothetical protein
MLYAVCPVGVLFAGSVSASVFDLGIVLEDISGANALPAGSDVVTCDQRPDLRVDVNHSVQATGIDSSGKSVCSMTMASLLGSTLWESSRVAAGTPICRPSAGKVMSQIRVGMFDSTVNKFAWGSVANCSSWNSDLSTGNCVAEKRVLMNVKVSTAPDSSCGLHVMDALGLATIR